MKLKKMVESKVFFSDKLRRPMLEDHKNFYRVCMGMTNYVSPSERVLFLDYDDVSAREVIEDMKRLSKKFEIQAYQIIESSPRSYWVISPQVFTVQEILEIMFDSQCDAYYIAAFKYFKRNVIRLSPKTSDLTEKAPFSIYKYVWEGIKKHKYSAHKFSAPHLTIMQWVFGYCESLLNFTYFEMEFCNYALAHPKQEFSVHEHFPITKLVEKYEELLKNSRAIQ